MIEDKDQTTQLQNRRIRGINRVGVQTLIEKEISRFLNVYTQTLLAPIITTLLFYTVFVLAFGGIAREVGNIPYLQFLAPGLLMMSMVQNAFANTSSSIVIAKVQGSIVDLLMPPLSPAELMAGLLVGGIARGLLIGLTSGLVIAFFVTLEIHNPAVILFYAFLGTLMLSNLGIAGGVWSQKFDHIAAVTNFLITPLTFLSGTFYAMHTLPPAWQWLGYYNPFFYMIDGFRFGFIGQAESNLLLGAAILVVVNLGLLWLNYLMLKRGYKIKS